MFIDNGKNVPPNKSNDFTNRFISIRSLDWWKKIWITVKGIEIIDSREMACCKQAWDEWLTSPHPEAIDDVKMMEAESGKYFNLIQLIAKVI